jgi:hypothetical protein
MLTRGHLIGQIVDNLTSIAAEARQRGRLHLFDLHIHIENFAKEVLNRTLNANLTNLNSERQNNPGLDLGDPALGLAFQVTGDKSLAKIRATLETITDDQKLKFGQIRILVIGDKQGSYSLDTEPFTSMNFTADMIWDFNDICAKVMYLPIDDLVDLSDYISKETQRVRIELEIPDADGKFKTDIEAFVEAAPKPQLGDGLKLAAFIRSEHSADVDPKEIVSYISGLSKKLRDLPRVTRQLFKVMVERRDAKDDGFGGHFRIAYPKLTRIYHGDDLDGDLALMTEARLIDYNEPNEPGEAPFLRLRFSTPKSHDLHHDMLAYLEHAKIDLRKPLVMLDFSDF